MTRASMVLVAGVALGLAGCVALPSGPEIRGDRDLLASGAVAGGTPSIVSGGDARPAPTASSPLPALATGIDGLVDGRVRFRELFCERLRDPALGYARQACEEWLWRLRDEPHPVAGDAAPHRAATPVPAASGLRLVIVGGAFGDCFGADALPFGSILETLRARGLRIETIQVGGRSGTRHNARQIVDALRELPSLAGEQLALLGYSKGALDILQALTDAPEIVPRVVAVVSLGGPIGGTPLAAAGSWGYDHLAARGWAQRCDPGDGGVVDSLVPANRRAWAAAHPLPPGIAWYSLAALPGPGRLAAVLRGSARVLARADRWNDGQVTVPDALLPGSTMLGLLNADHWGMALRIERELPRLASRRDPRPFPQAALLEAVLRQVAEGTPRDPAAAAASPGPQAASGASPGTATMLRP